MKVKDVLILSASMLEDNELTKYFNMQTENISEEIKSKLQLYLLCLNNIINEIALEYYVIKKEEEFVSDGKIFYSSFAHQIKEIIRIENTNGNSVGFECFDDHIKTSRGNVKVVYSIIPAPIGLTDKIEFENRLSERVLAYGVCSEYSLISSLYDNAIMWEKRYRESLETALRTQKIGKLKGRLWG